MEGRGLIFFFSKKGREAERVICRQRKDEEQRNYLAQGMKTEICLFSKKERKRERELGMSDSKMEKEKEKNLSQRERERAENENVLLG